MTGRAVVVSYKNKTSDVPEKCFAHTFGAKADDIFSTDHDSYIFISANTKDQGIQNEHVVHGIRFQDLHLYS